MSDDTLRELVKDTTGLLRELIMEQGKKIEQQLAESKVVVSEVKEIKNRLTNLENTVSDLRLQLVAHETSARVEKDYYNRDEGRSYEERKSLMDKVWDTSIKLAGVLALVGVILQWVK